MLGAQVVLRILSRLSELEKPATLLLLAELWKGSGLPPLSHTHSLTHTLALSLSLSLSPALPLYRCLARLCALLAHILHVHKICMLQCICIMCVCVCVCA
jgi:hypothetical protein